MVRGYLNIKMCNQITFHRENNNIIFQEPVQFEPHLTKQTTNYKTVTQTGSSAG